MPTFQSSRKFRHQAPHPSIQNRASSWLSRLKSLLCSNGSANGGWWRPQNIGSIHRLGITNWVMSRLFGWTRCRGERDKQSLDKQSLYGKRVLKLRFGNQSKKMALRHRNLFLLYGLPLLNELFRGDRCSMSSNLVRL